MVPVDVVEESEVPASSQLELVFWSRSSGGSMLIGPDFGRCSGGSGDHSSSGSFRVRSKYMDIEYWTVVRAEVRLMSNGG